MVGAHGPALLDGGTVMTRWRIFWVTYLGLGAMIDAWRESRDIDAGRTHSTGTTLSASTRWTVEHVPAGRPLFQFGIGWLAAWLPGHIVDHLDTQKADW